MEYLFYYLRHQHRTRSGKIKTNKKQQISVITTTSKSFYITFVDITKLHDVTIIDVTGVQ